MEFGFGSLLDKMEEYFGRRIAFWLAALVGFTAALACISFIATYISQLSDWLMRRGVHLSGPSGQFWRDAGSVASPLFTVFNISLIVFFLVQIRYLNRNELIKKRLEASLVQKTELLSRLEIVLSRSEDQRDRSLAFSEELVHSVHVDVKDSIELIAMLQRYHTHA